MRRGVRVQRIQQNVVRHMGSLVPCSCCGTYFPESEPHASDKDQKPVCEVCFAQAPAYFQSAAETA